MVGLGVHHLNAKCEYCVKRGPPWPRTQHRETMRPRTAAAYHGNMVCSSISRKPREARASPRADGPARPRPAPRSALLGPCPPHSQSTRCAHAART
eukprot:2670819-Prymnesium_polylepis.1